MKKEHFEILLEDIRGKFDLAMEGHIVLNKKIDDFRQEMAEFRQDTEFKHNELNKKIDNVQNALDKKIDTFRKENEAAHKALDKKIDTFRKENEIAHGKMCKENEAAHKEILEQEISSLGQRVSRLEATEI